MEILPYLPIQPVPDTARYPESTLKHSIRFSRLFLLLFLLMLPVSEANTKCPGAKESTLGYTVTLKLHLYCEMDSSILHKYYQCT